MSGLPEFNFPAFNAEAARLRALGYDVVNPAEIEHKNNANWHDCLRRDIVELLTCDTIALLPGWGASRGAKLEHAVAIGLDMQVFVAGEIQHPGNAFTIEQG